MPRRSHFAVALSEDERQHLESLARQYTSPYCDVIRAKIILLAAEGLLQRCHRLPTRHATPDRQQMAQAVLPGSFARPGGRTPRRAEGPLFPPVSSFR